MNQILEQYLRCYVNYEQNNWVELLPIAQFAYNSSDNEALGMSSFKANYGFDPEITRAPLPGELAPIAIIAVDKLKELQ